MASSPTEPGPQSKLITASHAHFLAHGNLLSVFSNRDGTSRLSAMRRIYDDRISIYEPNSSCTSGHGDIDALVGKLLSERTGWDFIPLGPVKLNHDFVYLAWGFGPRTEGEYGSGDGEGVDVKVTGADHFLVDAESGLIKTLYVLIDGPADVKV